MAKSDTYINYSKKFISEIVYLDSMSDDSNSDLSSDETGNQIAENSNKKGDDVEEIYSIDKYLEEFDKQHKDNESDLFIEYEKIASSKTKEIYFYLKQIIDNKNIAIDIKNISFQIIIHKLLYNMLLTTSEINYIAEKCSYICSISNPNLLLATYNQAYDNLFNDIKISNLKDNDLKYYLMLCLNEKECLSNDERIDLTNITCQIIIHKLLYNKNITPVEIAQIFEDEQYLDENYDPCFGFATYDKIYNLFNAADGNWESLLIGLEQESSITS